MGRAARKLIRNQAAESHGWAQIDTDGQEWTGADPDSDKRTRTTSTTDRSVRPRHRLRSEFVRRLPAASRLRIAGQRNTRRSAAPDKSAAGYAPGRSRYRRRRPGPGRHRPAGF